MLNELEEELVAARPYFKMASVGPGAVLKGRHLLAFTLFGKAKKGWKRFSQYADGMPFSIMLADMTCDWVIENSGVVRDLKKVNTKGHAIASARARDRDFFRKNGVGGHSWFTHNSREQMVVVFHDANRAGPHIDVHIGRVSLVYRVKPELYSKLKYNNQGMLTENSKKAILDHLRAEIDNGSRVPQNLDHSVTNARIEWTDGDPDAKSYGSGRTRQIVLDTEIEILKAYEDGPMEFYAPDIWPHGQMYLYRIYPGTEKRAPICIWGHKKHKHPVFEDRLHLKLTHPEDLDKVADVVDMTTATAKYDGSSCYFVIGPKGTTVWSPRMSKKTGDRIEYTFKIEGLAAVSNGETIVGMGELLFRQEGREGYLSCAEGGGILNSNALLPHGITPEIRVYRVDKVGRRDVHDLPFWENRELQKEVCDLSPSHFKPVELMTPDEALKQGFEGVVVVPQDVSVNHGFKTKWWTDPHDWQIDSVEFKEGEKGGVAGVVKCTSLDSGKQFNLGPGQVGDQTLTRAMMADPDLYKGSVIKVQSRHGHEGRASKMIGFHDDKGLAPR